MTFRGTADGLTREERRTYQALRARGYSHNDAFNDALDGVIIDDVREEMPDADVPTVP